MIDQKNCQQLSKKKKKKNCKQLQKTGQCSLECHNYSPLFITFSLTQKPRPNTAVKIFFQSKSPGQLNYKFKKYNKMKEKI